MTLPDVPSYSVVEVGWMGVAWVDLLVAKRPMMSQQEDQDTCLVSGSEQQTCTKGRRGLTSGACFQRCLRGLTGLDWNSARAESLQLRISDCPVGTLAGKKRHIETDHRREGDKWNFHGQR